MKTVSAPSALDALDSVHAWVGGHPGPAIFIGAIILLFATAPRGFFRG